MIGMAGSAAAVCVIGAMLAVLLKRYCQEQAMLSVLAICVILTGVVVAELLPIEEKMTQLFEQAGIASDKLKILWKALGICYMTGAAADICKDSGAQALANAAELFGRIALVLLALPLAEELLSVITGVLQS